MFRCLIALITSSVAVWLVIVGAVVGVVRQAPTSVAVFYFITTDPLRVVRTFPDDPRPATVAALPGRVWRTSMFPHDDNLVLMGSVSSSGQPYTAGIYRLNLQTGDLQHLFDMSSFGGDAWLTPDGIYWCAIEPDSATEAFPSGMVALRRMDFEADMSGARLLATVPRGEGNCAGRSFYGVDGDYYITIYDVEIGADGVFKYVPYLVNTRTLARQLLTDDWELLRTLPRDPTELVWWEGYRADGSRFMRGFDYLGPDRRLERGEYYILLPLAEVVVTPDAAALHLPDHHRRPTTQIYELDAYITRLWWADEQVWATLTYTNPPPLVDERLISMDADGQTAHDWLQAVRLNYYNSAVVFPERDKVVVFNRSAGEMVSFDLNGGPSQRLTDCRWDICDVQAVGSDAWLISKRYFTSEALIHDYFNPATGEKYTFEDVTLIAAKPIDLRFHGVGILGGGVFLVLSLQMMGWHDKRRMGR